jgi:deoxycytidylate deaminase
VQLADTCILYVIKSVHAGQDALVDLFARLEQSFQRLVTYTEFCPTAVMTEIIVKIIVEVLLILGIVTKEVGQGTSKLFLVELTFKLTSFQGSFSRSWLERTMSSSRYSCWTN